VPRIKHLIGNKLKCLPSQHRPMFEPMFDAHDKEVDKYCDSLQQSHQMLVSKQIELSEIFGEMIDEVLRATTQRDTQQEGINSYVYFLQIIQPTDNSN
jgi:transcription elongation factor Elf1